MPKLSSTPFTANDNKICHFAFTRNIACTILMTNDKNYVTVQLSMIVNIMMMMVVEW